MEACLGRGKRKRLGRERQSGRQQSQPLAKEVHGGAGTMHFLPPLPASITPTQWGRQDWDEDGGSEACRSDGTCCGPHV